MRVFLTLVAAAIAFSGAAFAEEGTTTTTGPAAMTDAEMDGVTAAGAVVPGRGLDTAFGFTDSNGVVHPGANGKSSTDRPANVPTGKGLGTATTPGAP